MFVIARNSIIAALLCVVTSTAIADSLEIDGRFVDFRSEGDGPPVVFVHGAISDRRVWDSVIDKVSKDSGQHRFVSYTQRHFGAGEGPLGMPEDFTRETHISDLIRFVETVGDGKPVTLVTWSYGGEIGLHAMMRRPELFGAALHFEPILYPLLTDLPGGTRAWQEKVRTVFGPAVSLAKGGDLEGAAMRFMEGVFMMPAGDAQKAQHPWPDIWRTNSRTIPAYGAMDKLPVTCSDLSTIKAPTLVIQGGDTHVDTAMMADFVTDCLGNAFTKRIPNSNHGFPMRSPEHFAQILSGFLSILD